MFQVVISYSIFPFHLPLHFSFAFFLCIFLCILVASKRKLKNVSGHHKLQQAGVKSKKNCNSLRLVVCLSLNRIVKPVQQAQSVSV